MKKIIAANATPRAAYWTQVWADAKAQVEAGTKMVFIGTDPAKTIAYFSIPGQTQPLIVNIK